MASNPRQIPAGGKDKISIVVHTNNRGGSSLTKRFRVTTNDPQATETMLMVTGNVESLVEISPKRVKISGRSGDKGLSEQVKITPQKGHSLTIKEVKASRDSADIAWDLKPLGKEPSQEGYVLKVTCNRETEGRSYDLLMVKTDMKDKPTIRIPVSCNIYAKPAQGVTSPQAVKPSKDEQKSKP